MKTKNLVSGALLLAIGYLLHLICPPLFLGMKPDLLLAMMFIAIILNGENFSSVLVIGIASGIITAITTTFPGGQIPNFLEKIFTAIFLYGLIKIMGNKINNNIKVCIISILGTLCSGTLFLTFAYIIVGLPGSFTALFISVVLPAIIINTVAVFFLYKVVIKSMTLVHINKWRVASPKY